MAEESPLSATGSLTEVQYEDLAHPQAPDGLIGHPSDTVPVSVSGGQILVRAGLHGLVRGFPWASGLAAVALTPDLTGPARTDLVVLRLFRDDNFAVRAALRTGTSTTAPSPFVGTGPADWYEIPLAEVTVANGALAVRLTRSWYLGEDSQLLCTSTSRPPHAPGRRIRETDTGRTYESTGSTWIICLDDVGTSSVPLASGWATVVNRLYRYNGVVFLHFSARRTGAAIATSAAEVTIGTLPAGFRSRNNFDLIGISSTSGAHVIGRVYTTGVITVDFAVAGLGVGQYLQLAPAAWPAA